MPIILYLYTLNLTGWTHTAKQLSLTDNFKELEQYIEGVGNPGCKACALKCFTGGVAIDAIRYLSRNLFQHYRLYQYLFTEEQEQETISIRVSLTSRSFNNIMLRHDTTL